MSTEHEINLYYFPGACSLASHILLQASGLPFKTTKVGFSSNGWPEEVVKMNPKKQVPFIELEPGVVLTEGAAIFTAISQLAPNKNFLGETRMEVLRSYEWFSYLSASIHASKFGAVFRPERYINDESLYPTVRDLVKNGLREAFGYVEQKMLELKPIDYENLRAVDAYLFVFFRWAIKVLQFDVEKDFPRYYERMIAVSKFEAVQKAMKDEGIEV
ncbi:MAG: hypothetical protein GOMPHAMPRED_001119 [Gomphillus americanus]|uniref:Glutathione S-transferase n=1 Tax=Gomphillus americanus TaxID=1940652 RepID=A0A8H3F1W0_9LECA|nr:MAG: hypothetical protein GOMPHAMPRED_001119 [Gomphillus americanus]